MTTARQRRSFMQSVAWTMQHELTFINGLGRWAVNSLNGEARVTLLRNYRRALARRTDWGGLDRDAVLTVLDEAINKRALFHSTTQGTE